jgi:plasmid replication initiation protein
LNDYRVYLNTIALIGGVTAQGKYIQPEELPREYRLSALEFAKQFNIAPNHAYGILKQATDKLMKTDVRIESGNKTIRINVCEKAEYSEKEGIIDILFTGSIMEYLQQRTKNFTLYNLKEVADLTSIYAVRLYELMQQFSSTTGMLIHTIEKWREMLGVQPTQYKLYGHLKDKVFTQALEEINLKTGYKLTMSEEKEGRKVVRVRFDFTPDMVYSGIDPRIGETVDRHVKPKTKKLTPEEIAKIEAKRAKQKEYRDRHKAKKLSMSFEQTKEAKQESQRLKQPLTENIPNTQETTPEVHPQQQELGL